MSTLSTSKADQKKPVYYKQIKYEPVYYKQAQISSQTSTILSLYITFNEDTLIKSSLPL